MARLAAYVHVQDDQGATHVLGPGDDVPAWAEEKITNPKAWDEAPAKAPEFDPNTPPARSGKGSSKEAWARFAEAKGFAVADGATRDDIIAELESHGAIQPEE